LNNLWRLRLYKMTDKEATNNETTDSINEWENADFLMAQQRLVQAVKRLGIDSNLSEALKQPKRSIAVVLPVRMDDGEVRTFWGYRVHHSLILGPGAGGLRLHPEVNLGMVAAMAMLMTWKSALMNLPFGGAHGGIRVDPKQLSLTEKERLIRRYVSEMTTYMGPDRDITGPDLNTSERTMAWILDTYSVNQGHTVPAVVTGKPKSLGGSVGLTEATGMGVAFCALEAIKRAGIKENSPKIIIQGFGHVGSVVASILREHNCKIVGLADSTGAVYNSRDGIDLAVSVKGHQRSFDQGSHLQAEHMSNEELLEQPCDVLIPCAVPNQLHKLNTSRLQCKLIVEGANAPVTPDADEILVQRGIKLMPDILANAAGVSVAYYEWVQGLIRILWSEQDTLRRLKELITKTCSQVFQLADEKKLSWRDAAMQMAVQKVVEARRLRGLYP
jgi:glutamate dehydrogenase (NAD(P)+)